MGRWISSELVYSGSLTGRHILGLLKSILSVVIQVLPFVLDWLKERKNQAQSAASKTRELQDLAAQRALLVMEGKEDEVSRTEYLRNRILYELLRRRGLRSETPPDA